ncbi:MAG: GIY-YIG nuclease family protein [Candidatus Omnitrophica bacterium]|nr:GIY-YIG nuclease family protein [Candidatus Omnitrophota bacterium]
MRVGYVYLLRSSKDGLFYLGWTTDLKRRLGAHNRGLVQSTRSRRPFELMYYEIHTTPKLAKLREQKLKYNPNMYRHFKKRALLCAPMPIGGKEVVG